MEKTMLNKMIAGFGRLPDFERLLLGVVVLGGGCFAFALASIEGLSIIQGRPLF